MSLTRTRRPRATAAATALGALALAASACAAGSPSAAPATTKPPASAPTTVTPQPTASTSPTTLPSTTAVPAKPAAPRPLQAGGYFNARAGLPHWIMSLFPLAHGYGGNFSFVYQDGRLVPGSSSYTVSAKADGNLTLTFVGDAVYHGTYSASTIHLPGCASYLPGAGRYGPTTVASCTFGFAGAAAAPASWTDSFLVISPSGLGDVHIGMSQAQAQAAANETFDGSGDGFVYHTTVADRYPRLWAGLDSTSVVTCVGAGMTNALPLEQTVVTPDGFMLGEGVQQLLHVYGSRAKYVPNPESGRDPQAGYVVDEGSGRLVFWVNSVGAVMGIAAGNRTLEPSYCTG